MSKIITFSRYFLKGHPKCGEKTFFIEKINKSLGFEYGIPFGDLTEKYFAEKGVEYSHRVYSECSPKYHTIRAGNRWKVGDKFSPRVWSGKPYRSKKIIIAPDIEIKKVYHFEIDDELITVDGKIQDRFLLKEIAQNDGLKVDEFLQWFKYPLYFDGQIICWSDTIEY